MTTLALATAHDEPEPTSETRAVRQAAASVASRIIGQCPHIVRTGSAIAEVIPSRVPVLLVGAPGTGKRYFARMIHELGSLSARPFVVLSGSDESLDAEKLRRTIDASVDATLFIDAIDRLSLEMQDQLFDILFANPVAAPARVLACSERLLDSDIASGQFRGELFDMFVTNVICVPSLHDRGDDLPELMQYFFDLCMTRARRTDLRGLSPEARTVLGNHVFFDNLGGLSHAIEHAVAFAQGPYVTTADLPPELHRAEQVDMSTMLRALPSNGVDLKNAVETFETRMILQALERTGWNKNRAAQLLGLNRTTLVEMIKRKRLVPPHGLRRTSRDEMPVHEELAAE